MSELLPCPFCGGKASVKMLEYGDDCKVWGVFCESDLESEYSHGHFVDNYATEAEAIAAWNSRAKRTCRNVHKEWSKISFAGAETSFCCSECGAHYVDCESYYAGLANADEEQIHTNYCPNCGARVVG